MRVLKFNKSFKIDVGWALQITNKKMSSVMPFAFNEVELKVVTVNGKPWTRAKDVCKALGYQGRAKDENMLASKISGINLRCKVAS